MDKVIDRVLEGIKEVLGGLGLLPQPQPQLIPIPVRRPVRRRPQR